MEHSRISKEDLIKSEFKLKARLSRRGGSFYYKIKDLLNMQKF